VSNYRCSLPGLAGFNVLGRKDPAITFFYINTTNTDHRKWTKKNGGESGIRTRGTLPHTRFPSERLRPLGHLSISFLSLKQGNKA
jgi:hypothetical protein